MRICGFFKNKKKYTKASRGSWHTRGVITHNLLNIIKNGTKVGARTRTFTRPMMWGNVLWSILRGTICPGHRLSFLFHHLHPYQTLRSYYGAKLIVVLFGKSTSDVYRAPNLENASHSLTKYGYFQGFSAWDTLHTTFIVFIFEIITIPWSDMYTW